MKISTLMALLVIPIILFISLIYADAPTLPYAQVFSSQDGQYFFHLIPESNNKNRRGVCYSPLLDGTFKKIWEIKNFGDLYSKTFYLSDDGKTLVYLEDSPVGGKEDFMTQKDAGVIFYREGKLIKKHLISDLLLDYSAVEESIGHYSWLAENDDDFDSSNPQKYDFLADPKLNYKNLFRIKTIDGILYEFDAIDGSIIKKNGIYLKSVTEKKKEEIDER